MKRSFLTIIFIISIFCINILAQDHGMYTLVRADMNGDINTLGNQVKTILESNNFNILYYGDVGTPDLVTEDKEDRDRKSTRLNSSHIPLSRMPSSA